MSPVLTVALLALGVLAVAFSGPLAALMTVPALAVAFWRNGIATVVLAPVAATRHRELRRLDRRTALGIVAAGVALAFHFATWISSLRLTSVASSMALVTLQVGWVVVWEVGRGRRYDARVLLGLAVAFGGTLVVTGVDVTVSGRALAGDLLAVLGGMGSAAYMVLGGRVRDRVSTTSYTFLCYGTCALLLGSLCLVSGVPLAGWDAHEWGLLLLLTGSAQFLGHSVFNFLLATVSPMLVSLVLLLEAPAAALVAAPLLDQSPPPAVLVGMAVILAGMALVLRYDRGTVDHPEDLLP